MNPLHKTKSQDPKDTRLPPPASPVPEWVPAPDPTLVTPTGEQSNDTAEDGRVHHHAAAGAGGLAGGGPAATGPD